ncbi:Glucose-6-phosphate isomerase [Mycoplasmopsis californica]|uniref:Glucose-6-phosphate isomerase n=1 Tax=Mycoplasmopsis equigenitalium TaxID=114883 RepID=A0ABY5J4X1_9BACT|nr:hypothetical protein [Mycoplasmopsis equigenitalium]UUD37177.1 hypothetical protein NPA09_01215 [Mycoplasmopsis equigenitalium]VEU69517.1 Glucose-6-phosphate isomerase [Mycoplasmopsis californica]
MSNILINYHNVPVASILEANAPKVLEVANAIENYTIDGFEYLSFKDVIYGYNKKTFLMLAEEVKKINELQIKDIVVICSPIVCKQLAAALDFLMNKHVHSKNTIKTHFISNGDSIDKINEISKKIQQKPFILINFMFSKNNYQKHVFEIFNNLLIASQGKYNSKKYIYFAVKTSDRENFYFAKYKKFNVLVINEKFMENFSFFSYPSLLILALNRVNVEEIIKSAIEADAEFNELDIDFNELLKYVTIVNALNRQTLSFGYFENKNEQLIEFTTSLLLNVSKKIVIQQKYPLAFYTNVNLMRNGLSTLDHIFSFKNKMYDYDVYDDIYNEDNLANINTLSMNNIQDSIKESTIEVKSNFGNTPIIEFIFEDTSNKTLSHFMVLMQRICILLRYLDAKNPFI